MTERAGSRQEFEIGDFLGAVGRPQSYLNILYLLLSFPLGIIYFVFLVTGFSLGIGLAIVLVGFFILLGVLAASRALASLERQLANHLLGVSIPGGVGRPVSWQHPWATLKVLITDAVTWKSVAFLLAKFPLGIVSFTISVVCISVTLMLVLAPVLYGIVPIWVGPWVVSGPEEALICLVAGLILGVLSIFLMNGIAFLWRGFAALMLSGAGLGATQIRRGPIVIP